MCPEEGEVPIVPDSPEWFAWLASLSSFRFVGQSGRFSARRGYNHRPHRGWYAQRGIHHKNYSKYSGVSEHITTARLEQVAAHFQSYLTLRYMFESSHLSCLLLLEEKCGCSEQKGGRRRSYTYPPDSVREDAEPRGTPHCAASHAHVVFGNGSHTHLAEPKVTT